MSETKKTETKIDTAVITDLPKKDAELTDAEQKQLKGGASVDYFLKSNDVSEFKPGKE